MQTKTFPRQTSSKDKFSIFKNDSTEKNQRSNFFIEKIKTKIRELS